MIRSFDPAAVEAGELDVDDPWYAWNDKAFDRTYEEMQAAVPGIVEHVKAELAQRSRTV